MNRAALGGGTSAGSYLSGLVVLPEQLVPLDDGLGALLPRHVALLAHRLHVAARLAQLLLRLRLVPHLVAVLLQQLVALAQGPVPVHQGRVQLLQRADAPGRTWVGRVRIAGGRSRVILCIYHALHCFESTAYL